MINPVNFINTLIEKPLTSETNRINKKERFTSTLKDSGQVRTDHEYDSEDGRSHYHVMSLIWFAVCIY